MIHYHVHCNVHIRAQTSILHFRTSRENKFPYLVRLHGIVQNRIQICSLEDLQFPFEIFPFPTFIGNLQFLGENFNKGILANDIPLLAAICHNLLLKSTSIHDKRLNSIICLTAQTIENSFIMAVDTFIWKT